MPIRSDLAYLLENVQSATAAGSPLKSHPFVTCVCEDLPESVSAVVHTDSYKIEGSAGKGAWANIPWLAVFDPLVTDTATRGFYVVYLLRRDGTGAYLSLNQATTEIRTQVSGRRYLQVLQDTAIRDVGLLSDEDKSGLIAGPIDLAARTDLAKGYEVGNILAREYVATALPSEAELAADLSRVLALYTALIQGRATVESTELTSPDVPRVGVEAKTLRWHLRAERSRSLAKKVKALQGDRCAACDKRMSDIYGKLGAGYIEAHHLTPFSRLRGRPTQLDPATDFAVLCPNCHAMVHRGPPYSIEYLRELVADASDQM